MNMKHNESGELAEEKTAHYLRALGYKILDRNWKTKQCEIDIVAEKDGCVHFVEVKYRSSSAQGEGYEYVTDKKLKQMAFAADLWMTKNKVNSEYVLSAASVSIGFEIEFIEEI